MTREGADLAGTLAEGRFSELYRRNMRQVLAYALRRCDDPDDAADVVAETFLTAWRRLADVPPGADGRLWLFGTARRVAANQTRSGRRRDRLTERLRGELRSQLPIDWPPEPSPLLESLTELPEPDRELLTLIAWEGLTPSEAAHALGITPAAARVRLHRARRRLRARLRERPTPSSQSDEARVKEAR